MKRYLHGWIGESVWLTRVFGSLLTLLLLSTGMGCSSLGGQRSFPGVAEYELTRIPHAPNRPVVVVIPETVTLQLREDSADRGFFPSEDFLTAIFVSALGRHGNIRLLNPERSHGPGAVKPGEKGPFRIKVMMTEIDQFSSIDQSGIDPWDYEAPLSILWKPPVTVFGFYLSLITGLPSVYLYTEVRGVVGIEVEAVHTKSGRVVVSFPVHGTHLEAGRQIGNQIFGAYIKHEARSTFSGASRVALNEVVEQLYDKLSTEVILPQSR